MYKATSRPALTTPLLHYSFPPNHVCSVYPKAELSRLGAASVPATHSPVLFPTAGNWALTWSPDVNIFNLGIQTNIICTKKAFASAAPELTGLARLSRDRAPVSSSRQDLCWGHKNLCICVCKNETCYVSVCKNKLFSNYRRNFVDLKLDSQGKQGKVSISDRKTFV